MIHSDNWIIQQCTAPTHELVDSSGNRSLIRPPYTEEHIRAINNWCQVNERDRLTSREYARPLRNPTEHFAPMIEPFYDRPVRYVDIHTGDPVELAAGVEPDGVLRKVISFGTSSYGYDVRISSNPEHIKVFTNVHVSEIDPKRMRPENFASPCIRTDEDGAKYVLIPAHSYLQAPTMEYFRIPRDCLVIVLGKSTYARSALICNVTPIEPEFEGEVVLEIANMSSSPVRCYLEEGVAQFCFIQGDSDLLRSYKDKAGKYMHQRGLQFAKV